jgi:hypothetical protein
VEIFMDYGLIMLNLVKFQRGLQGHHISGGLNLAQQIAWRDNVLPSVDRIVETAATDTGTAFTQLNELVAVARERTGFQYTLTSVNPSTAAA